MPVQTSRYVGFGVTPAAYPTAVLYTPRSCQNFRSAPQKQPIPNIARARPSGNGGDTRFRFTKCKSEMLIRSARPGNVSAADGIVVGFLVNMTSCSIRIIDL